MTYTLTMPLPPLPLRPNGRAHWRTKAKATALYRELACLVAKKALGTAPAPMWDKASVHYSFYFATNRFWDPSNACGSMKAAEDGLQDAGIIRNDRNLWPDRPSLAKDAANPRVVITVREETDRTA